MKPYSQRNLTKEQMIWNYRISRGTRIVEVLLGTMQQEPEQQGSLWRHVSAVTTWCACGILPCRMQLWITMMATMMLSMEHRGSMPICMMSTNQKDQTEISLLPRNSVNTSSSTSTQQLDQCHGETEWYRHCSFSDFKIHVIVCYSRIHYAVICNYVIFIISFGHVL